jgi:hypothetical protein
MNMYPRQTFAPVSIREKRTAQNETRAVQGCSRVLQGTIGISPALCKGVQGLQGFKLLSQAREKKDRGRDFLFSVCNRWGGQPLQSLNSQYQRGKTRDNPCTTLAQPLHKRGNAMPEDAFARFRRLRGVPLEMVAPIPQEANQAPPARVSVPPCTRPGPHTFIPQFEPITRARCVRCTRCNALADVVPS